MIVVGGKKKKGNTRPRTTTEEEQLKVTLQKRISTYKDQVFMKRQDLEIRIWGMCVIYWNADKFFFSP